MNRMSSILVTLAFSILITSCCDCKKNGCDCKANESEEVDSVGEKAVFKQSNSNRFVERVETNELIILRPNYSKIDLVCGEMPQKSDNSVILVAEAAYTEKCLEEFTHLNIAGYHVSNGVKYPGYKCTSNTGAFAYYEGRWRFCYDDYAAELDSAVSHHGAAFAQEMMIHEGKIKPTKKSDDNVNVFRGLCELDGRLCIIESEKSIHFSDFKMKLKDIGVTEALYLDMGDGWNYAWYRPTDDSIVELHPKGHNYCTNWITFYTQ